MTVVVKLYRENTAMLPEPEVLFKTPTANLGSNGAAQHPDKRKAGGHGPTLADEVCFLLNVAPEDKYRAGPHSPPGWWGRFAPAVHRWEVLTGKAAPVPVMRGPRGGIKLSPRFCEWLMGLPEGWVTDVPDVSVNEQLARIGNGVVPAQAYAAFKLLLESNGQWHHQPITEQPVATQGTRTPRHPWHSRPDPGSPRALSTPIIDSDTAEPAAERWVCACSRVGAKKQRLYA